VRDARATLENSSSNLTVLKLLKRPSLKLGISNEILDSFSVGTVIVLICTEYFLSPGSFPLIQTVLQLGTNLRLEMMENLS
jgi:hypothetical protein